MLCNTHLLSRETKNKGVLKINHVERVCICIYVPEKEQKEGGNKVSMETRELCLIGNNTSKISEIRSGIDMADTALPCSISIAFLFIHAFYLFTETDGVQSVFCDKYRNGFGCSNSHFSVLPISGMNDYQEGKQKNCWLIIHSLCPKPNNTTKCLTLNLTKSWP